MESEKDSKPLTLSGCLLQEEIIASKLRDDCILIIGDSRVGKSTLFNHLVGVPLKGVLDKHEDVILVPQHTEGVETSSTFKSVTLLPNIKTIDVNNKTFDLCDTAGFSDSGRSNV